MQIITRVLRVHKIFIRAVWKVYEEGTNERSDCDKLLKTSE